MIERRLIDANQFFMRMVERFRCNPEIGRVAEQGCGDTDNLRHILLQEPTVDPEALPIVQEFREKLGQYENEERNGRLLKLPCKIGDTVYQLRNKRHALGIGISERVVQCVTVWGDGSYALTHMGMTPCTSEELGKTWFLNKEEALVAQKELSGNERKN